MISPSRTNKPSSLTHFLYGRGVSERRWRSAANRPSRQARRGWASLYEAPSQKKNHLPRATKIQQPKKFLPRINLPQRHLPARKIPPRALPGSNASRPRLFRAKPGPIWVRNGLFWIDSGFSRAKTAPIWAPVPPPGNPLRPGRCAKTSPPSPFAQTHLPSTRSPKITQNII